MLITVKDAQKGKVRVKLPDNRLTIWDTALRMAQVFYPGAGASIGRETAHDDTEGLAFSIGQLTYLEQKAIAKLYAPRMFEKVLGGCIDYSAGPWAKTVDYISVKGVGVGQFTGPDSREFPMIDVGYQKATIPIASGQIGYQLTQEDLRASGYLKQPLSDVMQTWTVEAYKKHANYVALIGDTRKNFTGFYNASGVTAANRLSGAVWDSATADTIVTDIMDMYGKFLAANENNYEPSIMVVPVSTLAKLQTPRSSNSDTTIKKFIEETLSLKIVADVLLDSTANNGLAPGSGNTKRIVMATPINENMVFHIPMPITFLAPQYSGVWIVVPGEYKLGGFEARRPQTIRYMDGV